MMSKKSTPAALAPAPPAEAAQDPAAEVAALAAGANAPAAENTEAAKDSLNTGAPAEAEVASTVDAEIPELTGSEGLGAAHSDPAAGVADAVRRIATVTSPIELHGYRFEIDDPIPLTEAQFAELKNTGALAEADWDGLLEL